MRPTIVLALTVLVAVSARAQDISDPRRLLFAADSRDPVIDVIDLRENAVVYRIETEYRVDDLVVTPNAPILVYTSITRRQATFYDLQARQARFTIDLPIAPRHIVLSPRGDRLAVTDSAAGGFLLLSTYTGDVVFALPDLAPTPDVLFDPNEIDIWFANSSAGSVGLIDTNTQDVREVEIAAAGTPLSSPSRSLDGRYVYIASESTGAVYSLNAFSRVVFRTYDVGTSPARPYTTPEGSFLYLLDRASGRFVAVEQFNFEQYANASLQTGVDLVAVGRFDRLNLFASTANREYRLFDNLAKQTIETGRFPLIPLDVAGSADGRRAYIAFGDGPTIGVMDLERRTVDYIDAGNNGIGAMTLGLTNNVCH